MIRVSGLAIQGKVFDPDAIHKDVSNEIDTIPLKLNITDEDVGIIESKDDNNEKRKYYPKRLVSHLSQYILSKGAIDPRSIYKNIYIDWEINTLENIYSIVDQGSFGVSDAAILNNGTIVFLLKDPGGKMIYTNGPDDSSFYEITFNSYLNQYEYLEKIEFEGDEVIIVIGRVSGAPLDNYFKLYKALDSDLSTYGIVTFEKPIHPEEKITSLSKTKIRNQWIMATSVDNINRRTIYIFLYSGLELWEKYYDIVYSPTIRKIIKTSIDIYIAIGDHNNLISYDSGESWAPITGSTQSFFTKIILCEPDKKNSIPIMLAIAYIPYIDIGTIYRSDDGGISFYSVKTINDGNFRDIIYLGYNWIIACGNKKVGGNDTPAYYSSYDNGITWDEYTLIDNDINRQFLLHILYNYFTSSIYFLTETYNESQELVYEVLKRQYDGKFI